MRLRSSLFGVVLAAVAVAGAARPAAAAEPLAPGGSQTIVVTLPDDWATEANRLSISVADLEQHENECLPSEVAAGDKTCEPDDGELAGHLVATAAAGTLGDANSCDTKTPEVAVDLLNPSAEGRLDVHGLRVACLVLKLAFPDRGNSDNLVQSDSFSFTLKVVADDVIEAPGGNQNAETRTDIVTPGTGGGAGSAAGPGTPAARNAPVGNAPAGSVAGPGAGTGNTATGNAAAGNARAGNGATGPGAGSSASGSVLGTLQTPVAVGDKGVAVQTRAESKPFSASVLAWGSLFLGLVIAGGLLVLFLRRRRRERAV